MGELFNNYQSYQEQTRTTREVVVPAVSPVLSVQPGTGKEAGIKADLVPSTSAPMHTDQERRLVLSICGGEEGEVAVGVSNRGNRCSLKGWPRDE